MRPLFRIPLHERARRALRHPFRFCRALLAFLLAPYCDLS